MGTAARLLGHSEDTCVVGNTHTDPGQKAQSIRTYPQVQDTSMASTAPLFIFGCVRRLEDETRSSEAGVGVRQLVVEPPNVDAGN